MEEQPENPQSDAFTTSFYHQYLSPIVESIIFLYIDDDPQNGDLALLILTRIGAFTLETQRLLVERIG